MLFCIVSTWQLHLMLTTCSLVLRLASLWLLTFVEPVPSRSLMKGWWEPHALRSHMPLGLCLCTWKTILPNVRSYMRSSAHILFPWVLLKYATNSSEKELLSEFDELQFLSLFNLIILFVYVAQGFCLWRLVVLLEHTLGLVVLVSVLR